MERAKTVRDLVRQFDRQAREDFARSPLTGRNQRSAINDAEGEMPAVAPTDRKAAERPGGDEKTAVSITCGHAKGENGRYVTAFLGFPVLSVRQEDVHWNGRERKFPVDVRLEIRALHVHLPPSSTHPLLSAQLIDSFVSFRVVFVGKLEFEPTVDSQRVLERAFRFALRGSDEKDEDEIDRILGRFVPLEPEEVDVEVNVARIAAFRSSDRLQPLEIHPKAAEECEVRHLEGEENAITMIVSRLWSSKHVHVFRSPLREALEFRAAVRQLVEMIEHNTRIEQLEWEEEWHAHNEQLERLFADLC
ncbi:hypothetical protein M3Y99_00905100 [Aphelenchoides fujianensis]|nr:hypothetical protein M3Y99_00905100 [Aphelenchoides fujianensis]